MRFFRKKYTVNEHGVFFFRVPKDFYKLWMKSKTDKSLLRALFTLYKLLEEEHPYDKNKFILNYIPSERKMYLLNK